MMNNLINTMKGPMVMPKPVRYQPLTEQRKYGLLKDVQFIGTIMLLVENRWHNNLFDTNLNNQTMKNFSAQIYKGTQGLKRELLSKFNLKEPDELQYEMCVAMDRVVRFFSLLHADLVNQMMDGLEAGQAELMQKYQEILDSKDEEVVNGEH